MTARTVRLEHLIGRRVDTVDGFRVGHIEEIRAERHHGELELVEYHLGTGALLERWSVTRRLFGRRAHQIIVRWDQIDIAHRDGPRLLCPVEELEKRTI
jgi:sporulation protein YlmC with PRC-barrel domain